MKDGGFITFPAVRGKRIQIEACAEQATTLRARCALAKLPNRLNIGAEQLVSGESRPWGGVNAWIAAPEDVEPWAELR